ncbi:hypothetical protein [Neisseria perflava]|uniref:hypothetical protein n=1 Tax=Neisseria perflava TaxID=33053 RepID=UPI00209FBBB2|nr:hypothetical protein [Neisseria perflava]MCP1660843.1 hypothetical protein [Neisseria perflava]
MLSFNIYAMTMADYRALADKLAAGSINPLVFQDILAQHRVVSGYDYETAAYINSLIESGWAVVPVRLNEYTQCLGVQSGLLESVLNERVAFIEANLLPDIRQVNKSLLAKAAEPNEWTVVLVEEN